MADWLLGLVTVLGTLLGPGDADPECLRLGGLDIARAKALTAGEPAALLQVYATPAAAAADADVLRRYAARGLSLGGAGTERLECRVVERSDGRVVLDVVDRPGPTWVTDEPGRRRELPRAAATRRSITLAETGDGWRVLAVATR